MSPQKRKCLDNSPEESRRHAAYAQVKGSRFEKNVIIVEGGSNDDIIVVWGYGTTDDDGCTRDEKPKSNEFLKNIIIAKSGTMFKIGDGATSDNNTFRGNKLHKDGGSAEKGNMPSDGISDVPLTEEERRERKGLEQGEVGPLSERSDQGHCTRDELSSLVGERCS
jgi:hypothetical protein